MINKNRLPVQFLLTFIIQT